MATYKSIQINLTDAEMSRVKKRLIDEKMSIAELFARLGRKWLAREVTVSVGESGEQNKSHPAT